MIKKLIKILFYIILIIALLGFFAFFIVSAYIKIVSDINRTRPYYFSNNEELIQFVKEEKDREYIYINYYDCSINNAMVWIPKSSSGKGISDLVSYTYEFNNDTVLDIGIVNILYPYNEINYDSEISIHKSSYHITMYEEMEYLNNENEWVKKYENYISPYVSNKGLHLKERIEYSLSIRDDNNMYIRICDVCFEYYQKDYSNDNYEAEMDFIYDFISKMEKVYLSN